jgi:nucleotide-binding universal stress UspA family protein
MRPVEREHVGLLLVPTDFSPGAEPALRWAATLADASRAEILLLHVLDFLTPALAAATPETGVWIDDQMMQGVRREASEAMARQAARLPRVRTVIREGMPRSVILEVATEAGADLIVMGTHGRTGLAHMVLGSVAEHVVRHSSIPVLTVRLRNDS